MALSPIYPTRQSDFARAWLDVDLGAVRHNAAVLRARAGVPLLAMVKANSYGVGAVAVTRALGLPFDDQDEAPDAPWAVGIATLDEAEALRESGCRGRIVCLQPLLAHELPRAHELAVRPSLHRAADIASWATLGSLAPGESGAAPWHLSIDTGMARAGIRWDQVASLLDVLRAAPPEGVFTHFHSADESVASREEQDARFAEALRGARTRSCPTERCATATTAGESCPATPGRRGIWLVRASPSTPGCSRRSSGCARWRICGRG